MVSLSNGGLSDVNLNKRPLENGYCSSSSGVSLKYKPRKVSCVRDFPPGCGRDAPRINLRPQETVVVSAGDLDNLVVGGEKPVDVVVADCVKTSEVGVESQSDEVVRSPVQPEIPESLDDLVGKVVTTAGMLHGDEKLSVNVEPLVIGSPKDIERIPPELSKKSHEVAFQALVVTVGAPENRTVLEIGALADGMVPVGGAKSWSPPQWPISDANVLEEIAPKNKYPQRRVSATRDFPPFCGRNAPHPTEEERLRIVSRNKNLAGTEKDGVEGGPLRETVRADVEDGSLREAVSDSVEESERDVQDGNAQKSKFNGVVPEPRNKSQTEIKRSIEDVRGSVGKAGKEVVIYSHDKSLKRETVSTSVEESERDVQDGNAQKSGFIGILPEPRNKSQTVIKKRFEDVRGLVGKVGKEVVVYSHDKSLKRETVSNSVEESERDAQDGNAQKSELIGIVPEPRNKSQTVIKKSIEDVRGSVGKVGKEVVVYSHDRSLKRRLSSDPVGLGCGVDRVIVQGLMAAPNCPWRQGKGASKTSLDVGVSGSKVKKHDFTRREKSKFVTRTNNYEADYSGGKSMKEKSVSAGKAAYGGTDALIVKDEEDSVAHDEDQHKGSPAGQRPHVFAVALPPFGPNSSSQGDGRNKVRETLRLFQAICRKILQGEEAKLRQGEEAKLRQQGNLKRIDLQAAKIVREKGKEVNTGKQILGAVPGVEVGDEFQYRVELALIGVHRLYQAGIDYINNGGVIVATSIVASGGYADDLDNADVLIYSGQGGNLIGRDKQPEDQKLERGNLALKNSISLKNPIRVIRGSKETKASDSSDARAKVVVTYTYDGLYTVDRYWQEPGPHGKLVFKFELRRIPGQPELAWKEVKKSKKFKIRVGLCVDDISGGKELFPICAVNTIDNEKPPPFTYITRIMYPDWYRPIPPKGCDCIGGCSDSQKCSCAVKNGGEIPYNHNGAIVEVKPLVYECGPSCKCPPSCYNRVSQHGIKIQLEIFKTESRGWGVRSLTSIPSGSFICEYTGKLLEDKEAEQRTGDDEYLFDIGQNYNDCSLNDGPPTLKPDAQSSSSEVVEDGGYTIDAAQYGNVGRFINHSCSPNLYAQNVIYDHNDKRMPHIMLFAAENIPPLQELTYHYNYSIDQIRDSNGNIRMKSCYCGSTECTGRMY